MNIEIANKLQKLRKANGYSQEELADKLGISRQAVSKWERAESSPDTDNLIILAKLYNVSLDDLLSTDESIDEIMNHSGHILNQDYMVTPKAKYYWDRKKKFVAEFLDELKFDLFEE